MNTKEQLDLPGMEDHGENTELIERLTKMSRDEVAIEVKAIASPESFEKMKPLDFNVIRNVALEVSVENPTWTERELFIVATDRRINALAALGKKETFEYYLVDGQVITGASDRADAIRRAKEMSGD